MTGIWFDTCLRLEDTLEVMLKTYGNRKISITRESETLRKLQAIWITLRDTTKI